MHIPDGFLSGGVAAATGAASLGAVAWAVVRAERAEDDRTVPLLGTTAAFVFAAQMLNFPVAAGTTGHFLGAGLVAALTGPLAAVLVLALVLAVQALVFADGGVTALGANVFNMGVVGGLVAWGPLALARRAWPGSRPALLAAAGLGAWASVVAGAAVCAVELALSGASPLGLALGAMTAWHALIGVGEALITTTVLGAVLAARPDLVAAWAPARAAPAPVGAPAPAGAPAGGWTPWRVGGGLALAGLLLGGLASPWAAGDPDGLERVAHDLRFAERGEGEPAWTRSPIPDYAVPGVAHEGAATGLAGVIGTALVLAAGLGLGWSAARAGRRAPPAVGVDAAGVGVVGGP